MEDTHNIHSGSGEEHQPQEVVQPVGETAQPGKAPLSLPSHKVNPH